MSSRSSAARHRTPGTLHRCRAPRSEIVGRIRSARSPEQEGSSRTIGYIKMAGIVAVLAAIGFGYWHYTSVVALKAAEAANVLLTSQRDTAHNGERECSGSPQG